MVIYTFLQHTDKTIPHYDERQWTWLKGALSTIDRNYPGFINALHYDIGSTHVVHHIFHELPFYNAPFASIYVKELLGDLYNYDSRNIWRTLFECCKLIAVKDDGTGVYRFWKVQYKKNKNKKNNTNNNIVVILKKLIFDLMVLILF